MTDKIIHLGMHFGKTGKVLVFFQQLRCLIHQIHIQLTMEKKALRIGERIFHRRNKVLIGAAFGIKAGVGRLLHRKQTVYDNVFGQKIVELVLDSLAGLPVIVLIDIKVGVVAGRVHTRIGASATCDGNPLLMQQKGETFLQSLLHRRMVGLDLPTEIRSAVVCQMEKVSHRM